MEDNNHPSATSPSSTDASLHRKHAAMIQRLSDLHQSRISHKANQTSSSTTTSESFLTNFLNSKQSIESQISLLPHSQSTKPDLDAISLSISDLEQLLATHSYLLPSYELRSCLDSISSLKSSLNSVSSTLAPKKKFSFKNKSQFKNPTNPITQKDIGTEVGEIEVVAESRKSYDSPGFKDKENGVLVKNFRNSEGGEFVLVNLEGCEVRLIGCFRALFVHKLKNCRVYVGPVHGSVLIEEVEDCVFVLASHQIRIHHAKRCDFYLRVRSRPIIEDSDGVRFAPYCLRYDEIDEDLEKANLGEESGNWANVDDFKWLRAVQSPNWSVLQDCDRIGVVSIQLRMAADC